MITVFSHLHFKGWAKLQSTSKRWQQLLSSDYLWGIVGLISIAIPPAIATAILLVDGVQIDKGFILYNIILPLTVAVALLYKEDPEEQPIAAKCKEDWHNPENPTGAQEYAPTVDNQPAINPDGAQETLLGRYMLAVPKLSKLCP